MRDMMRGPAIRDLIDAELVPGAVANDQAAIEEDIRARAATYFHPSGTCRMGSDPTAVVDPRLRAKGIDGIGRRLHRAGRRRSAAQRDAATKRDFPKGDPPGTPGSASKTANSTHPAVDQMMGPTGGLRCRA